MGETKSFGFYGLRLGPGTFFTLAFNGEAEDAPDPEHADFALFDYRPAELGPPLKRGSSTAALQPAVFSVR